MYGSRYFLHEEGVSQETVLKILITILGQEFLGDFCMLIYHYK